MSKHNGGIYKSPVAKTVPFDPSNCDAIDSKNVQGAIEDICAEVAGSGGTGYVFGREGVHNDDTWLICAETISSKRGLPFGLSNGFIKKITVSTQNIPSATTIELYYHDGNSVGLTLVGAIVTTNTASTEDFSVNFAVPKNHQLAALVKTTGLVKPRETSVIAIAQGEV